MNVFIMIDIIDWNRQTKLLYIVRKDYGLNNLIPPFS